MKNGLATSEPEITVPTGKQSRVEARISLTKKDFPVSRFPIKTITGAFLESSAHLVRIISMLNFLILKFILTLMREYFDYALTHSV